MTDSSMESENSFGTLSTKETETEKVTYDHDGIEISYERSFCRSDETTCPEEHQSDSYSYGQKDSGGPGSGSVTYFQETGRVVDLFEYLNIISLIMIILVIVLAPVSLFTSLDPKIPAVIALMAFILALLAPVLMAAALPNAIEKDVKTMDAKEDYCPNDPSPCTQFAGSTTYTDPPEGTMASDGFQGRMTWGPDFTWAMSIVAMVLMCISMILLLRSPRVVPKPG